jgi:hypothetical protein
MVDASQGVFGGQSSEVFEAADWLRFEGPDAAFHLIVGDKIFDNVDPRDWPVLAHQIQRMLVPEGMFVTRLAPVRRSLMGMSFSDLLSRWGGRRKRGEVDLGGAVSGLWEEALGASTTEIPGIQTIARFDQEIARLQADRSSLADGEAQVFDHYLRSIDASRMGAWSAYSLGQVIDALGDDLTPIGIHRSHDYPAGPRQPIVAFGVPAAVRPEREPDGSNEES